MVQQLAERWFTFGDDATDAVQFENSRADWVPILRRRLMETPEEPPRQLAVLQLDTTGRPELTDLPRVWSDGQRSFNHVWFVRSGHESHPVILILEMVEPVPCPIPIAFTLGDVKGVLRAIADVGWVILTTKDPNGDDFSPVGAQAIQVELDVQQLKPFVEQWVGADKWADAALDRAMLEHLSPREEV